ncbi:MAG: NAD(P)-dependent alcohol dehydrogenase [Alphaproteobacteria bacterium]
MAKAIVVDGGFGIDRLALVERPGEEPGPGQVRLAVRAVSLNRRDLLLVQGVYNPRQRLPVVPCSDAAGIVEAIGPGCTRVKTGDRVVVQSMPGWLAGPLTREALATALGGAGGDGTLRETMLAPEQALLPIPGGVSLEAAATLPCAALTAWSAIVELGQVRQGETVLTQGTGGVSLFAVQFARRAGARVIATTSSEERAHRLRALGADTVLLRSDPDWPAKARDAAGDIDLIVELGGGNSLATSLRLIRPGGTIALIGVLGGAEATVPLPLAVMRQVRLQGVTSGSRASFAAMLRAVDAGGVDPVIGARFPLARSAEAFALMADNGHVGKIVISPGEA